MGIPPKNNQKKVENIEPKNVVIRTTLIPDFALNTSEKPRFATPFLPKTQQKRDYTSPKKITAQSSPLRVVTWLHPVG